MAAMMAALVRDGGCPRCAALKARVVELEAQLAAARKDSGNSSKPPPSDIVKPPKEPRGRRSKRRSRYSYAVKTLAPWRKGTRVTPRITMARGNPK